MNFIKQFIKNILYHLIPKKDGYSTLKVISGPAKGAILSLDVRIEGAYWLGTYDRAVFAQVPLNELIKPGDVVWDCGVYVGYYTAILRNLVGASGIVHSFEASQTNYERIRHLPERNHWTNVHIHYLAVGKEHATLEFAENLGAASGPYEYKKATNAPSVHLKVNKVKCCGVDELVYEENIPAPDFIKFDLESAEEFALHNGDRLFTEKRPVILLELHGAQAKQAAGLFLEKYNYEGVLLDGFKERKTVVRSSADFETISDVPYMVVCLPLNNIR